MGEVPGRDLGGWIGTGGEPGLGPVRLVHVVAESNSQRANGFKPVNGGPNGKSWGAGLPFWAAVIRPSRSMRSMRHGRVSWSVFMPLLRFHCTDGENVVLDLSGRNIPYHAARQAAGAVASRLVEALPAHEWGSWNVVVHDDQGYTVEEVAFPEHSGGQAEFGPCSGLVLLSGEHGRKQAHPAG